MGLSTISEGAKKVTKVGAILLSLLGASKEGVAQTLSMSEPVTSTLDPLRKQSDFVFHAAPGDSIMQVTNTSTVPNAEIINRFIDPSGQFYSGTFHFNPNDPNPDGTTGTGDELLSVGGGYAVNMQARGNKLLIESDGTMVYNPLAPVQIVGLPTLSTITGEPIECTVDTTSDGYNINFSHTGAGTALGSADVEIRQDGTLLYSGSLAGSIALVTSSNADLHLSITPGADGYMATLDSLPIQDTITGLAPRLDNVAVFNSQNYRVIAQGNPDLERVLFPNTTGGDLYYKLTPTGSGQPIDILVNAGDTVEHDIAKQTSIQTFTVSVSDNADHDPQQGCVNTLNNLTISGVVASGEANTEEAPSLDVYPNPASESVHFDNLPRATHVIDIYSIMGEKVIDGGKSNVTNGKAAIDVSQLASGIYLARGYKKDEGDQTFVRKFSITH